VTDSSPAGVTLCVSQVGSLFADQFVRPTDPGSLAPWMARHGNWTITDAALKGGTNPVQTYAEACVTNSWTNYSVQARIQLSPGAFGGGVGGRLDSLTGARYAAWIYPEGSPGGSNLLKLLKFQNWTAFGYNGTDSAPMQQVSVGAVGTNWHSLKLAMVGRQIAVYYDGTRMISLTDEEALPYLSGGISLGMWTASAPYVMSVQDALVLSAPAPRIEAISLSGTNATITWGAIPGQTYVLQHNEALDTSNWSDSPFELTATNVTATATVTNEGVAQRSYRVMLVP